MGGVGRMGMEGRRRRGMCMDRRGRGGMVGHVRDGRKGCVDCLDLRGIQKEPKHATFISLQYTRIFDLKHCELF